MSTEKQSIVPRNALNSELGPSAEERAAWYHKMQATQPVRYRPEHNMWEVFRYKDVQRVLTDHAAFTVDMSLPEDFPSALGKTDPPHHRQLRTLVSKAFTPRRIEQLAPRLTGIIDGLLEPAIRTGRMDVVAQLTYPLPVRVIAEMLGLPAEDEERFRNWSYQLLAQMVGVANPDNSELIQYFAAILTQREQEPRDDLISALLAAEAEGAHLTHDEIIAMCLEMLMAGNVTTTMLLSRALHRFCQRPEVFAALRADPSLIPGAIEELLRYEFSSVSLLRVARQDTTLGGHEIKAGQVVAAWTAAANFDETYFPHAEEFDIRRSPNPHMTFGYGIHFCLGAPLARLETRVALERIALHFSHIRLDPEHPPQYMDLLGELIQSLTIIFTPVE